jgi:hypothetical protein
MLTIQAPLELEQLFSTKIDSADTTNRYITSRNKLRAHQAAVAQKTAVE